MANDTPKARKRKNPEADRLRAEIAEMRRLVEWNKADAASAEVFWRGRKSALEQVLWWIDKVEAD